MTSTGERSEALALVLSDTHVGTAGGAAKLCSALRGLFPDVDLIVHAGDFTHEAVLDGLERVAPVLACYGNADSPALKERLPRVAKRKVGSLVVGVTHHAPSPATLSSFRVHVLVTGHTHVPRIEESPSNVLLLNPGSPTCPRAPPPVRWGFVVGERPPVPSVILLRVHEDRSSAFVVKLGSEKTNQP